MSEESMIGDPFNPLGVTFNPVSPALIKVRLIATALTILPIAIAFGFFAHLFSVPWLYAGTAVSVLIGVWLGWLIPRQVRAMGYARTSEDLLWRKGVMFRSVTVVPYGRMQYVDVNEGPIARHYGIATVTLHTASASTDATIHGLPKEEAAQLREQLSALGEARLAGL
ncbi:PH domain-containing protein [Actinomyces vulturis]|uniref:PH domain-containing protein n=1 Tax=Actinomyces vulturis TaxID=1857645 RepID=UPI00082EFDF8|nr:PH domain-containing protein [Actinomyces vulturis]